MIYVSLYSKEFIIFPFGPCTFPCLVARSLAALSRHLGWVWCLLVGEAPLPSRMHVVPGAGPASSGFSLCHLRFVEMMDAISFVHLNFMSLLLILLHPQNSPFCTYASTIVVNESLCCRDSVCPSRANVRQEPPEAAGVDLFYSEWEAAWW